jgi:uncharacterized protein YndB with AHSA1/START domain
MTEDLGTSIEGTLHSSQGKGLVRLSARFEHNPSEVWAALAEPERLAGWFGKVSGDLRVGGEFAAFVYASEWDGHGRVDECAAQKRLVVTMWEEEGVEHTAAAELEADGRRATLQLQVSGVPVEYVWAYAAGWQEHLADLGAFLEGRNRSEKSSDTRFDEFATLYKEMAIVPLED